MWVDMYDEMMRWEGTRTWIRVMNLSLLYDGKVLGMNSTGGSFSFTSFFPSMGR